MGAFIRQDVTLGGDKTYLLDIETEATSWRGSKASLPRHRKQKWDKPASVSPWLGADLGLARSARSNGTLNTRHTVGICRHRSARRSWPRRGDGRLFRAEERARQPRRHRSRLRRLFDLLALSVVRRHARRNYRQRPILVKSARPGAPAAPISTGNRCQRKFVDGVQFLEMWTVRDIAEC